MSGRLLPFLALAAFALALWFVEESRLDPEPGAPDGCVACHSESTDPSPNHPVAVFGCSSCHLGNPHALTAERAHASMVLNPADLRVADRTCGREDCHPDIPGRVKKSLMATNKGILNTLYYHWENGGEEGAAPVDVAAMLADPDRPTLAQDQFAKMCAGCHLWRERGDANTEADLRGGGCAGCHVVSDTRSDDETLRTLTHGRLTTQIPAENCVRCHSRSARSGLAYAGVYESAGYGTPLEQGRPGSRRLSGERFYNQLPPDVHHTGAMACIDCHTHLELMGDGESYEYQEQQTDVRCETCHEPDIAPLSLDDPVTGRLLRANPDVNATAGTMTAMSPKGAPLYNLRPGPEGAVLLRKLDGEPMTMAVPKRAKPHHDFPGHERLSCQTCHSPYMPQCYGCHLEYRRDRRQTDALSGRETPGRWIEGRSYMRVQTPILGVDGDRIVPFAPSHALVSVFNEDGAYVPDRSVKTMAMTTFDPHSTQLASRTCADCHGDPKTLGLGEGRLRVGADGELAFTPLHDPASPAFGAGYAPDAFVSPEGEPLQTTSRTRRRPFNGEELRSIVRVTACLGCHDTYDDPVYADFETSLRRFRTGDAPECTASR